MKKILSIMLCLAMAAVLLPLFALPARADESFGDWRYEIDGVGNATVTKYEGAGGDLTIPAEMDGHKTVNIQYDAFSSCKTMTGITIPEGVKVIGENAFMNCSQLTVIRIPSTMEWIDDSAFLGCSSLHDVYYNGCEIAWWDKVEIEGSNDSLIGAAFHYLAPTIEAEAEGGWNRLEWTEVQGAAHYRIYRRDNGSGSWNSWSEVARPSSGSTWNDNDVTAGTQYQYRMRAYVDGSLKAFSNIMAVKAIPVWEYIVYAGEARLEAYHGAGGSVTIPSKLDGYKVTTIGDDVFAYRSDITSVAFPTGLKEIGSGTFKNCSGLTNVTIPDGVWLIESAAFQSCSSLKSVTLPASVTAIGNSAFLGCKALKNVYYGGTKAQWAEIDFAVENEALTGATIHFGDVPVLKSATASPGQITVKWNAVSGAAKYAVYRRVDGEGWTRLTNTVTDTSYTDKSSDLKAGTTYYYTVRAYVNNEWGAYDPVGVSAQAAASTAPVLKSATAAAGQITVKWSAVSGATKYAVYRKAAGESSWTRLTNAVTGTSFTDKSTDFKAGTVYYYTVRAYKGDKWGGYDTDGVSAKAVAANYPALTSATPSAGQITVKWSAFSGASKYAVYRKAAGDSGWTRLTNTVTGTSYTDKSVKAGTTYYYTVRAYVGSAWGSYDSKGVSAKAVAANYPVLTSATPSAGQITVKWSAFSGASKYAVYRKAAGESSWTRLTNTVTGTSYTDKSVKAGTTYYYTVRAYVGSAWGGYDSKGVSAKAK